MLGLVPTRQGLMLPFLALSQISARCWNWFDLRQMLPFMPGYRMELLCRKSGISVF